MVQKERVEEDEEEDEEDGDWQQPEDEDEDEPLEYSSDLDEDDSADTKDVEMQDAHDADCDRAEREEYRRFCIRALTTKNDQQVQFGQDSPAHPAWYRGKFVVETLTEVEDEMFPLFRDGGSEHDTDTSVEQENQSNQPHGLDDHHDLKDGLGYYAQQQYDVEHIAGPGCVNLGGYSGHEISVEEMRGCQVSQCLMRKPRNFEPLDDDEEFERTGKFCLSGLSDYMPSRDHTYPRVKPPQHGCERPNAENTIWEENNLEAYAMPLHPWCFEISKRTSMLAHGTIDVGGLTSWWVKKAIADSVLDDRIDTAANGCRDQEWLHRNGTEYLAANPLYLPKLREILQQCVSTDPAFSPRNSAFAISHDAPSKSSRDLFTRLPAELHIEILDHLRSKDIASLRLASRAFRHLPISYFQKLLNRELPWLWEAHPTTINPSLLPYSFWVTVRPEEAVIQLHETQKMIDSLTDYVQQVSADMPELKYMLEEALPAEIERVRVAQKEKFASAEGLKPFYLPPDRTDYHLLFVLLRRHWEELHGFKNRQRIWKLCKDLGRRIARLRTKGKIGPLLRVA